MDSFIQNLDIQQRGIWFPLITGVIALFFILFMPKRKMNWREIYITFGVIGYVTLMLDVFIVGEYFDLFDLGDPGLEGIGDLMTYAIIPSCLAIAYLNFYDRKTKWFYVFLFTIV
jgi:lipoprotein signal peptidase